MIHDMKAEKTLVANWGNFPKISAEMNYPENRDQLWSLVKNSERLIARGNGKCYGDAALSPRIVSTLALNRILDFDSGQGVITCEAGVLLADVLDRIVPAGWFFHVTPGIKNITVGGAIASDVHGKNHPAGTITSSTSASSTPASQVITPCTLSKFKIRFSARVETIRGLKAASP